MAAQGSFDPAAHQLQLSLVVDFLKQHGMGDSLAALTEEIGAEKLIFDRPSLVKSLRLSKFAEKGAWRFTTVTHCAQTCMRSTFSS